MTQSPFVMAVNLRGREEGARPELAEAASLRAASGGSSSSYVLTSSLEASPAKTSPSPAQEPDSLASDQPSSSTSPESPQLFSVLGDGCSLRTWTDSFPQTVDEISPSFSRRWPSSGFTISPGECSTADTSECPSGGDASSSLPDVLLADVPPRFYLSPRAAAGLLRRAAKRGRALPQPLAEALAALASQHRDNDKRTTRTSSERSTPTKAELMTTPHRQGTLWDPSCEETGATTPRSGEGTSLPASAPSSPNAEESPEPRKQQEDRSSRSSRQPSPQPDTMRARMAPGDSASSQAPSDPSLATTPTEEPRPAPSLRRLTPSERELLQGFPVSWSVPYGPSLAPRRD
jgi:hypothetical protein